jgi:uncharacterized protein
VVVGICTLELALEGVGSLKDKRRIVKSLTARLRREFNISVAEVGALDRWEWAVVGVACVSNDRDYVDGLLARVVRWVESSRMDLSLMDYQTEIL